MRKLLLQVHLPKETQQIDRTMEAFAERYHTCNPALFPSHDQPYILAFSIIMLHTDAFNKSNKNKMSRADYVKNTKVEGITPIVLEVCKDFLSIELQLTVCATLVTSIYMTMSYMLRLCMLTTLRNRPVTERRRKELKPELRLYQALRKSATRRKYINSSPQVN